MAGLFGRSGGRERVGAPPLLASAVPLLGLDDADEEEARELLVTADLLRGEAARQTDAFDGQGDLDRFFTRIYNYFQEKGFWCIVTSRVLNLATLAFTIAFSALLLLVVDWAALRRGCPPPSPPRAPPLPAPPTFSLRAGGAPAGNNACDIVALAIRPDPLAHLSQQGRAFDALVLAYLAIFSLYWLWTLSRLIAEVAPVVSVSRFMISKLGIPDRDLRLMPWADVVDRLVAFQAAHWRAAASSAGVAESVTPGGSVGGSEMRAADAGGGDPGGGRPLTAHDIASRIMRKENYLIGLINKRALPLALPWGGRPLLTKTLEWNVYWRVTNSCVLDCMFDGQHLLRADFLDNVNGLRRRFRAMAVLNLALSPFLAAFLLIYFFLRNAERFYRQPGAASARRWSPLAKWRLREFNELPHLFHRRLAASLPHALRYRAQFANPALAMAAKFVAFVVGALAAGLLGLALMDERLLEATLWGRALVWHGAILGTVLAVSRGYMGDESPVFDPETAMVELAQHTHWLPRRWRGRAHTAAVQSEFDALFANKAALFGEEMLSVALTPLLLWFALPAGAPAIVAFVRDFTAFTPGVGHVCSLSAFEFGRHGSARYGSPVGAARGDRSSQGKMEKSLVAFAASYPNWAPPPAGRAILDSIHGLASSQGLGSSQRPPPPPPPRASRDPALGSLMHPAGKAAHGGLHGFLAPGTGADRGDEGGGGGHHSEYGPQATEPQARCGITDSTHGLESVIDA